MLNAGKRILIVDDDNAFSSIVKAGLETSGYQTETAASGAAALNMIRNASFAAMVTDIVMPGMDGIELSRRAKEIDPNLRVLAMTGFPLHEFSDRAFANGVEGLLEKPFDLSELLRRLELLLDSSPQPVAVHAGTET